MSQTPPNSGSWSTEPDPTPGWVAPDPIGYEPARAATPAEELDYPVGGYPVTESDPSTTDVAKGEAADLKDTAVDKGQQVAQVAKDQATEVKDTAVQQGQQVAEVAKEEAGKVKAEATGQLKDLLSQSRSELTTQAGAQQQRLGGIVHSLAQELGSMASSSDKSGPLTDLAHQAAKKGGEIGHWLENGEPSDVLNEVTSFARRRPVAFLGASLLAGIVVGRLSRSLAAEAKDAAEAEKASTSPALETGSAVYAPSAYATTEYAPADYATTDYGQADYGQAGYAPSTTTSGVTTQGQPAAYDPAIAAEGLETDGPAYGRADVIR